MMQKIFSPSVTLMNRMSYTQRLIVLWLLSLAAITVIAYSLFVHIDRIIHPAQRQLEGLVLVGQVSMTVRLVQQHRGYSSALLGGNNSFGDRRAAKEREAAEAFQVTEGVLPADLASGESWLGIKASWEHLRKEGLNLTTSENFIAHTGLIRQMRLFHATAADEYMLGMDPEIGSFYLIDTIINKLPDALEHFGQIRGYGAGILANKRIAEHQKIKLGSLIAELDSAVDELVINLEKTGRYNPAIQASVSAASMEIADSVRQITGLAVSDIATGRFATSPAVFVNMTTAAIDRGYAKMHETLIPMAEFLIKARIDRARNVLYLNIGVVFLLCLAVAYLSAGIYYSVLASIQSLAHSARAFANGDLSRRITLNTHDELGRIGKIFNEMADGFSALLELHRKSEKALSDLSAHLQTVREEEKANLAREIHDDLSGALVAIKMDIYCLTSELIKNNKTTKLERDRIESILQLLDNTVGVARNIIANLRPTILDDLGLLAAIEWQTAQFHKRTGIETGVYCVEDLGNLDRQRSIALFRILQEALTNISRHAGASRVEVEFRHSDDEVSLSVSDNGCGMTEQHAVAANSYGIRGMRERTEQLGGKIEFGSPPGGGLVVTVTFPLPDGKQEGEAA